MLFASQRWTNFIVVPISPEAVKTDNIVSSMEQLNPNDLLIYARVAEAGSFSRAAERLGLPKSTVSRRIAHLEELLGVYKRLLDAATGERQAIVDEMSQITQAQNAAKVYHLFG